MGWGAGAEPLLLPVVMSSSTCARPARSILHGSSRPHGSESGTPKPGGRVSEACAAHAPRPVRTGAHPCPPCPGPHYRHGLSWTADGEQACQGEDGLPGASSVLPGRETLPQFPRL